MSNNEEFSHLTLDDLNELGESVGKAARILNGYRKNVTYKINSQRGFATYIHEYWDDILIYKWRVSAIYDGGDIREFMERNDAFRMPNFDGVNEYHRRIFILDL